MVVALWAWTVFGVEKGVAGTAWSPTVFLLALHSCADEYAAHMYVKVAACYSQRLWSCARSSEATVSRVCHEGTYSRENGY